LPSIKTYLMKLGKPAYLAAGAAAASALPKKSFEDRKARSKSADKERKDRSQSRGKKLFGALGGKKEEVAKTEEEVKPEGEAVAATEPVAAETAVVPAAEETVAETAAPTEEASAALKKERRGSKFLDYLRSATSPTREKKIEEVVPASEGAVAASAPVIPDTIKTEGEAVAAETPAVPETVETEASKAEETVAEASKPKESRRASFFGALGGKKAKVSEKVSETKASVEDAVKPTEEAAAVEEPAAVAAPVEAETAAEPTAAETAAAPTKKENPLVGLARRASTAIRGSKKGKTAAAPATTEVAEAEEATKPAEEIAATSAEPEKAVEEVAKPAEETVVPEATPIAASNPTVTATA
jgi:hypothetical protein